MEKALQHSVYRKKIIVSPSMCDASGSLGYADAFAMFQDIAAEHAEEIGVGAAAMQEKGVFWLVTQTKLHFYHMLPMMTKAELSTWPVTSKSTDRRVFRCYRLLQDETPVCEGRTLWTILNTQTGRLSTMGESGFPDDFPFCAEEAVTEPFLRFHESFLQEEAVYNVTVRPSHTDFGGHMNNVSYVRILLDAFTNEEISDMQVKEMEIRYASSCFEGDTLTVFRRRVEDGWLLGVQKGEERPAAFLKITL